MEPLISVIVPVYKVERYLDECVASIVNQTYQNLEIILVDDGSPDSCPQMCDAWAARDPRIKVIHKKNGGAAAARNTALDVARGQYIGFVDSDDCIRSNMYEVLLGALQGSRKKIASCYEVYDIHQLSAPVSDPPRVAEVGTEDTLNGIFQFRVGTSLWRRLFERSVFDHIRLPEGEVNEEYPILIPMTVAAGGMVHVRERLYFYRPTEGSITSSYWKTDGGVVLRNLEIMREQLRQYGLSCDDSFFVFTVKSILGIAIDMDKHLPQLSTAAKRNFQKKIQLLRKHLWRILLEKEFRLKEKILCTMVAMRILRPIYRILRKI